MSTKSSHFGMAGHYAAMSEFLLRGYNVAIPSVDVGDDVFVVDDQQGTLRRVQVKTAELDSRRRSTRYTLSRRQLREQKASGLYFMFMVRWGAHWRFLLIPQDNLIALRDEMLRRDRTGRGGRKPLHDALADSDALTLDLVWADDDATGWGASLKGYLDRWPDDFPELAGGPGARVL